MPYNVTIICIEYGTDCERCGYVPESLFVPNKEIAIEIWRDEGWLMSNKGYAICPECRKKYGDKRP